MYIDRVRQVEVRGSETEGGWGVREGGVDQTRIPTSRTEVIPRVFDLRPQTTTLEFCLAANNVCLRSNNMSPPRLNISLRDRFG